MTLSFIWIIFYNFVVDKSTGKRYIRRYDAFRLGAGYNKDLDVLLVEIKDTVYVKDENEIEYHLGKILEYNIKKRKDGRSTCC